MAPNKSGLDVTDRQDKYDGALTWPSRHRRICGANCGIPSGAVKTGTRESVFARTFPVVWIESAVRTQEDMEPIRRSRAFCQHTAREVARASDNK